MAIQSARFASKPAKSAVRKNARPPHQRNKQAARPCAQLLHLISPLSASGRPQWGLESVTALLEKMRVDTGMALVVAQHLDSKHFSKLSEMLVHTTTMPIFHYALNPGGCLMLGASESIGMAEDLPNHPLALKLQRQAYQRMPSVFSPAAEEELTTVNEEFGTRNAEQALVNNDLNNLLSSINIPVIIVDGTLVIRHVTPLARNLFNLLPGDVGRQISDINTKLNIPDLEGIIREVNDTLAEREIEVTDGKRHCYSLRVRPYRTTENKIAGTVITLVDIQEIKRLANLELDRVTQSMLKIGG